MRQNSNPEVKRWTEFFTCGDYYEVIFSLEEQRTLHHYRMRGSYLGVRNGSWMFNLEPMAGVRGLDCRNTKIHHAGQMDSGTPLVPTILHDEEMRRYIPVPSGV